MEKDQELSTIQRNFAVYRQIADEFDRICRVRGYQRGHAVSAALLHFARLSSEEREKALEAAAEAALPAPEPVGQISPTEAPRVAAAPKEVEGGTPMKGKKKKGE